MQGGVIAFPNATGMFEELLIICIAKGFVLWANNNLTFRIKLILQ
jgi:hypothetical protein